MNEIENAIKYLQSSMRSGENQVGTYNTAIQALQEKLEREENKPLTVEELKNMIGKPVYVISKKGYSDWHILESVEEYNETIRAKNAEEAKKKERWKPFNGEKYYFLDDTGVVEWSWWHSFYCDVYRWNEKNCFQTYEEAKRKQEILDFIHERLWFPTQAEFEDSDLVKFCIEARPWKKSCEVWESRYGASELWCFRTKEIAQEVADFIGYDDFIKYL